MGVAMSRYEVWGGYHDGPWHRYHENADHRIRPESSKLFDFLYDIGAVLLVRNLLQILLVIALGLSASEGGSCIAMATQ